MPRVLPLATTPKAERAGGLMLTHVFEISDDTHHSLAASLPQGRLFESGKAFVSFVEAEVFSRLVAAAGLPDIASPFNAAGKATSAPSGSCTRPTKAGTSAIS